VGKAARLEEMTLGGKGEEEEKRRDPSVRTPRWTCPLHARVVYEEADACAATWKPTIIPQGFDVSFGS
jgi:hypothetical protein